MKDVFVALSGGADSAYAVLKLKKEGYNVIGAFMDLGLGYEALDRAKLAAFRLGIPLHILRLKEEFEELVVKYFIEEYLKGKTPNPCAICNRKVKFGVLREQLKGLGVELFATGHYACLKNLILAKGKDETKDQSYFLSLVPKEGFSNVLFPLCAEEKRKVEERIREIVPSKESQEICFLKGKSYQDFLLERIGERPGRFVDTSGKVLGNHKGHFLFTIGQRRGLGISLGRPLYVVDILANENLVVLGDEQELYKSAMQVAHINWFIYENRPFRAEVKIRRQHTPQKATVHPDGLVVFDTPQRAITPGQIACFYRGNLVAGAGIIEKAT